MHGHASIRRRVHVHRLVKVRRDLERSVLAHLLFARRRRADSAISRVVQRPLRTSDVGPRSRPLDVCPSVLVRAPRSKRVTAFGSPNTFVRMVVASRVTTSVRSARRSVRNARRSLLLRASARSLRRRRSPRSILRRGSRKRLVSSRFRRRFSTSGCLNSAAACDGKRRSVLRAGIASVTRGFRASTVRSFTVATSSSR